MMGEMDDEPEAGKEMERVVSISQDYFYWK